MAARSCVHGSCLCELGGNVESVVQSITERVVKTISKTLSVVNHHPSSYPNYVSKQQRLASFSRWTFSISVEELVSTGFFSTGLHDIVCCFHCGVTLGRWEEDYVPTEQHLRASPDCEYLQLGKYSNETSDEAMACKICLSKEKTIIFLPCGHYLSCNDCILQLKTCPVCRRESHCVHKVYNS